jgi:site-specific recombinase XerD
MPEKNIIPSPQTDIENDTLLTLTSETADTNPAAVYLASLSSRLSRYTMTNALRTVVAVAAKRDVQQVSINAMLGFNWGHLRYQHTAAIRAQLAERYAPSNANRIISALRGVLKEAWRLGYMTAEEYQRATDIRTVKAHLLPKGRDLDSDEIKDLIQVCRQDPSPAGIRDIAMIGLLYTCGLRRSELVELRCEDFNEKSGQLKIRKGKGRKQRTVYVTGNAHKALVQWLDILGREPGPLFEPILKSGKIQTGGLVAQSVYDILKKRATQAGISDFSPHDFRRTFVGDMLDSGVDIATVANIAGHSSVETTRRYDRRPETIKKDAAEKLTYPLD